MPEWSSISVKIPDIQHLPGLVQIHVAALGYTFNSQLGDAHLATMYRCMMKSHGACVLAAFDHETPVGLISGALDMDRTRSEIVRTFTPASWLNILFRCLIQPQLVKEWWKGNVIGKPVYALDQEIHAILTSIAVKPRYQRMGIGKELIEALEQYFLRHHVQVYRLDTLLSNTRALSLYKKLGFEEVTQRADSIVLVKRITAS